jgi:hypothetical protein
VGVGVELLCRAGRVEKDKAGEQRKEEEKARTAYTLPNYLGGERDDSLGRRGSIKDSRGSGATRRTWLLLVESALLPL